MNDNTETVKVSVFCLAYNTEKYIRQTLDGFVKQKTDFEFEVFVHDDASTDGTADIIREYEKKYKFIKPVFQKDNQYSSHIPIIATHLLPNAKGNYFAWCEGDDYWTDPYKLQKQVKSLERNPNCVASFCNVQVVNTNGVPLRVVSRLSTEGIIPGDDFVRYCLFPGKLRTLPMQISGLVIRREIYEKYINNPPPYTKEFVGVGDIPLFLTCGLEGDVFYINELMSCYRTGNPSSWSGKIRGDISHAVAHYSQEKKALLAFNEYTKGEFSREANKAANLREFIILRMKHDLKHMNSPEMKEFFQEMSRIMKMKEIVFHYFPFMETIWRLIKN